MNRSTKVWTWDRLFDFPSEGRHAEDFYIRKIRRPGLNPRTGEPEASMLTTRPPKPLTSTLLRGIRMLITLKDNLFLSQNYPIHKVPSYSFKTYFNITNSFRPRFSKRSVSFQFSLSNSVYIVFISQKCHMLRLSHRPQLIHSISTLTGELLKITHSVAITKFVAYSSIASALH
jgi:hypothetical protein